MKGKVESILQRLSRLKVEGSTVGDHRGEKRKVILFECVCWYIVSGYPHQYHPRALEGIKDELLLISERSSADGYEENDADIRAVCELAENLRDVIVEYQVSHIPMVTPGKHR